jgi:hypothetical protein
MVGDGEHARDVRVPPRDGCRRTPRATHATVHPGPHFVSPFSLILSWATGSVDICPFSRRTDQLDDLTDADDNGLVVRTPYVRGPIPFKCTIRPRIPNVKESLLAALQD